VELVLFLYIISASKEAVFVSFGIEIRARDDSSCKRANVDRRRRKRERAAQEKKKSKVSLARKNTFQRNNPLH
jgi:hypothetical protein